MNRLTRRTPTLECLDERNLPAPLTVTVSPTGAMTITGTASNVGTGLELTTPAPNTVTVTDGGVPVTSAVGVSSITITLDASADRITLGLLPAVPLSFTGNISINTGLGDDTVDVVPGSSIGGNLSMTNVNSFEGGGAVLFTIGGNLTINNVTENVPNAFVLSASTIGGAMSYTGANDTDDVSLLGSTVGGNASLNMGNGTTDTFTLTGGAAINGNLIYTGGSANDVVQLSTFTVGGSVACNLGFTSGGGVNSLDASDGTIGRNLSVSSGAGNDNFTVNSDVTVGGSVTLNLGGGTNIASFMGIFGTSTSSFNYTGGVGMDSVTFQPATGSARVRFTANLGAGMDSVMFNTGAAAATNPSSAYIDFGAGVDSVMGTLNFAFTFLNLP